MFGRPERTTVSLAAKSSPLGGPASYYGQAAEIDLKRLGRREWWLWFSALTVTAQKAVGIIRASQSPARQPAAPTRDNDQDPLACRLRAMHQSPVFHRASHSPAH